MKFGFEGNILKNIYNHKNLNLYTLTQRYYNLLQIPKEPKKKALGYKIIYIQPIEDRRVMLK